VPIAWNLLRNPEPITLAAARRLAHRALQWPALAARANLKPKADDSHSAFTWDADHAALLTQPLKKGYRAGLRLGTLELVLIGPERTEVCGLIGSVDADVSQWLDEKLAQARLKPASGAALPYEVEGVSFGRARDEAPGLAALAGWFAAGAQVLDGLRAKHKRRKPGAVLCWPHHFDIAVLVKLEAGAEPRSIGVGLSPGDDYYAQPYFYLSPWPKPATSALLPLPPGGPWHTRDFFGAVATATDVLALPYPDAGLEQVLDAAFAESLQLLGLR